MNLETEYNIFGTIKKFTQEQVDTCDKEGECIYESLNDAYLAQVLSNKTDSYKDTYDEWLLAIQTTASFNDALHDLSQQLAKILYAKKRLPEYYEYEAN